MKHTSPVLGLDAPGRSATWIDINAKRRSTHDWVCASGLRRAIHVPNDYTGYIIIEHTPAPQQEGDVFWDSYLELFSSAYWPELWSPAIYLSFDLWLHECGSGYLRIRPCDVNGEDQS